MGRISGQIRKRAMLAGLLAATLLLGGCMAQIEERPMADVSATPVGSGVKAPAEDAYAASERTVTLYFLTEDGTALRPVVRRMEAPGSMSRAEAAFCALMEGPEADEHAFWPEMGNLNAVRAIEISGDVATVDLPARVRELPQERIFAVRQAIANTLTEFTEISYVNVLIGGREEGLDLGAQLPVGTLTRMGDMDMGAAYTRLDEQRQSEQGVTRLTTLYFPTEDGRFVLPEVRTVSYGAVSPIEYLYQLLAEMGKESKRASGVPAPMRYITEMPEIVRTQDGAYRAIEIRFDASLDEALAEAGLTRGIYMAMLTDTLMGFVPGVEGLQVSIGGELLTGLAAEHTPDGTERPFAHRLATREDFAAYAGAPVTLYTQADGAGGLVRTAYILAQARQNDLRARLEALMSFDEDGERYALPSGLTAADVLAVRAQDDEIAVNLSEHFASRLRTLSPREERTAIYAMVNTLTEDMHAQRVRFFFEGEQIEMLSGELEMRGAFLRNPGMVVE